MNAFVLVIMYCSGHVNAECHFRYERYPTAQECAEAMNKTKSWTGIFGSEFSERAYDPTKVLCLDSKVIIFPEGNQND